MNDSPFDRDALLGAAAFLTVLLGVIALGNWLGSLL